MFRHFIVFVCVFFFSLNLLKYILYYYTHLFILHNIFAYKYLAFLLNMFRTEGQMKFIESKLLLFAITY